MQNRENPASRETDRELSAIASIDSAADKSGHHDVWCRVRADVDSGWLKQQIDALAPGHTLSFHIGTMGNMDNYYCVPQLVRAYALGRMPSRHRAVVVCVVCPVCRKALLGGGRHE